MVPAHEKLAAHLEQAGILAPHWRTAFERVERHRFLPDQITDPDGATVDRLRDEGPWLELAYDDVPIITRAADDTGDRSGAPATSVSPPSIVADMLSRLDVFPGMRVLEVGTSIGYNTALLSQLLGDDAVTSIEVDPELAERARVRLLGSGFGTLVVTGDGAQGWPARAPFNRVISTAAVQRVPYHWVAQTHPGGKILAPWGNAFHSGALAELRVGPHGTARGHSGGDTAFMWVRDQSAPRRVVESHVRPREQGFELTSTQLHPYEPINDFDAGFAIGLRMPTVLSRVEFAEGDEQRFTVYLVDPDTASWASWHIDSGYRANSRHEVGFEVRQHGPRKLFAELEAAYGWWQEAGRPDHTRFGLTVSADRQLVWLDEESNTVVSAV